MTSRHEMLPPARLREPCCMHWSSISFLRLFAGEKVTEPHDVRCDCEKCLITNKEDSLRHSRSRINAYKALSSPCYISLSSRDPIMTAFDLNRELKRLSRIENEFKQEYEQLAQQCQDYSAALLAETRSSKELEIILNYDADNPPVLSEANEKMHLSRLKLAIRYKQKNVIDQSEFSSILATLVFLSSSSLMHIVNSYWPHFGTKVCQVFVGDIQFLKSWSPPWLVCCFLSSPSLISLCHAVVSVELCDSRLSSLSATRFPIFSFSVSAQRLLGSCWTMWSFSNASFTVRGFITDWLRQILVRHRRGNQRTAWPTAQPCGNRCKEREISCERDHLHSFRRSWSMWRALSGRKSNNSTRRAYTSIW